MIYAKVILILALLYILVGPTYQAAVSKSFGTRWLIAIVVGLVTLSIL